MQKITLNGQWKLSFTQEFAGIGNDYNTIERKVTTIPATVPGNVELDLVSAGLEPDPFWGTNLYLFRKYEFYRWWFEKDFELPVEFAEKNVQLKLHGVDTFATIYLNGKELGRSSNMLVEHTFDLSSANFGGTNHLTIMIESTINVSRKMDQPVGCQGVEQFDDMVLSRKPGHCFAWDIGPRLVSAGLWKDVEIVALEQTAIKEVYIATKQVDRNSANLHFAYRFNTDAEILDGFHIKIKGTCGEYKFEKYLPCCFTSCNCSITVQNPLLWWPKGYGEPNLYDVTVQLWQEQNLMDSYSTQIGIREIKIETRYQNGDDGEFKIWVNHTPIMALGSNWVFLDALHSRDAQRLDQAIDLFIDSGCNITRCWGGNVYESDRFYELCDNAGIMVWQDFCFACGFYPQDDDFGKIVEHEAALVIRRLRNHASIILWAGDNEIDALYYHAKRLHPHARFNRISREWLPIAIGMHDPFREYIPSSPYIPEHMEGDLSVPEQHNWGPRDYFKGDFYKHSNAHFISEAGYHGCPAISSIKKFIPSEELWPFAGSDSWDTHNTDYIKLQRRAYNRNELMADQVRVLFGSTTDESIEEFALASQISQAEAKKYFIERVRLKKWRVTGIIWWNMLDGWPQISDAVVDYYFHKKLAFYYISRSQQPVCMMMDELEAWEHKVVIANDTRETAEISYTIKDENDNYLLKGTAIVGAGENVVVGSLRELYGQQNLYLMSWNYNGKEYGNHYVSGYPSYSFEQYKTWLSKIELLPNAFNSTECYL